MWDELSVYFGAACVLWFILGVTRLAPWWRHDVGRTMMYLSALLLLAATPAVLHFTVGWTLAVVFYAWFYRAVWITIGVVHLWRWWVYRRIQRENPSDGQTGP